MGRLTIHPAEYTILITDRTLQVLGDPIYCWDSLDVVLRWNEPGSGMAVMPGHRWIRDMLVPGARVCVIRNPAPALGYQGEYLLTGPIENWKHEQSDNGENAGIGKITVNFADDLALVMAHVIYPNPAQTPAGQTTDSWTFTGNAEVALRNLVDLNAGAGALPPRQVSQLSLDTLASIGTNVTINTDRMQPIGDVMRAAAELGGGIGFRTRQVGTAIKFGAYLPPDVSNSVRFGFNLGNMAYRMLEVSAPTVTAAIVGGQGEGADRNLIERVNLAEQATWQRMETLVSRPGNSPAQELIDDGDKALADGASTTRIATNVRDSPDQRFGIHYGVGYRVGVETADNESITDVVKTVHLQAWRTAGEYVAATIGSQAAKYDPHWAQVLRDIDARVGKLERTVKPAVTPP